MLIVRMSIAIDPNLIVLRDPFICKQIWPLVVKIAANQKIHLKQTKWMFLLSVSERETFQHCTYFQKTADGVSSLCELNTLYVMGISALKH